MANIWVRKPIAVLQAEAKEGEFGSGPVEAQLRRTLSLGSLVALGIGCTIGAGIFVLTGHAAAAQSVSLSYSLESSAPSRASAMPKWLRQFR
jgi:APA family basic amino acid/polyamine antiporter